MKTNYKPDISVIIPIHNSEDSILRCLSSVQDQAFNNIEIICIDDCSNDSTNKILRELAKKDKRIIILENKKNVGPGVSRNKGIDIARGDYLIFIDADDYVDKDLMEALYNKAISGSFDIVKGVQQYKCLSGETIEINRNKIIEKGISNGEPLWYLFNECHQGVLYKNELFNDKQIRYGSTYIGEDSLFLLKVGHKTKSIGFIDSNGSFYYRVRTLGSLTDNFDRNTLNEIIKSFQIINDYIKSESEKGYAVTYFVRKIYYYLGIHRYISTYNSDDDLSSDFLKAIKKEALRFPDIESVKKKNIIIMGLIDYDVNLFASSKYLLRNSGDITYLKNSIKEWIRFTQEHPQLKSKWKLELINILTKKHPIYNNKSESMDSRNDVNDFSAFLDNELKKCTSFTEFEKLSIKVLAYIRKYEITNKVLSFIKKLVNKVI